MSGVGAIKGITFQMAQALSDVVDLVAEGRGAAVTIEGAADVVDYEVLDDLGQPIAVRQAKARQEPGTWGANELAKILFTWGQVDYAETAEFAFVTDASVSNSGQRLQNLIAEMRRDPDENALRGSAASFRPALQLPPAKVLQRVQILTRMGSTETVLAKVEMRILALQNRARLATAEDAQAAANKLLRKLFITGGTNDFARRTISRAEVLEALGVDEASLQGDLAWSQDTAAAYGAALVEDLQDHEVVAMKVIPLAATPRVLQARDPGAPPVQQPLETVLGENSAALVGPSGEGKSTALRSLAGLAAQRGQVPVILEAAGHSSGALPRRVRNGLEAILRRPLTAGAVQGVLAAPELLLLIDGVSEVSPETRASLSSDLLQLAAQRPLRVIAAGRDLPQTISGAGLTGRTAAFRIVGLDHGRRLEIAAARGRQQAVNVIEHRLGTAVDNPMAFTMALNLSTEGVPRTRAEIYSQFVRGLVARAGADDDIGIAALGVAWAAMIGRGQRTADHYSWRLTLGAALDGLAALPAWRGHGGTADAALTTAQRTGLLARPDPDGGLAPLHDSFADFLAARAIVRQEASLPARLAAAYDETILFMVELAGLDDALALRISTDRPLLACRVARQRQACGRADARQVGSLLQALLGGRQLPALPAQGIRVCQDQHFTGAVIAGEGAEAVDAAQFGVLAAEHPAMVTPAGTCSLQLAVTVWATAVKHSLRPGRRVFQPSAPADADGAGPLLVGYLRETTEEIQRLANICLPETTISPVLAAIGPPGITAYVADPEPGPIGRFVVPIQYYRSAEYSVSRGQPPAGMQPLSQDTLGNMMRLHPAERAASEIGRALDVLTGYTWPAP